MIANTMVDANLYVLGTQQNALKGAMTWISLPGGVLVGVYAGYDDQGDFQCNPFVLTPADHGSDTLIFSYGSPGLEREVWWNKEDDSPANSDSKNAQLEIEFVLSDYGLWPTGSDV